MRLLPVALVLLLAGCFAPPEVPPDAARTTDDALPGITLAAWTEHRNGFTYLHAVATNDSETAYKTKEDCGYLWQSELRDANGTELEYTPLHEGICDWFYDEMRPGAHREFLHSWDHTVQDGEGRAEAPEGPYTWTIRFLLRDGADHDTYELTPGRYLEITVPVTS